MIVMPRRTRWVDLIFRIQGTVLVQIKYRLLAVLIFSLLVTYFHEQYSATVEWFSLTPFSLIGLALSIFLGFRNNTSYDRFWEGRKLWGGIVNTSRTATRRVCTLIDLPVDNPLYRQFIYQIAAYVHALRMHLRDEWHKEQIAHLLSADMLEKLDKEINKPIAILHWLAEDFARLYKEGRVHAQHLPLLEDSLHFFTDLQGGCERIKSTPIPFSYNVLIHRIVAIYCFSLPFGLLSITHWFTPLVTVFVAYAFLGIDAIGEEIEEPFGYDKNDLPLEAISTMIEVNVRQRIPDVDLPSLKTADIETNVLR